MLGIKEIVYEKNGESLIINISDNCKISYKYISRVVDNELIFKYLEHLFRIIDDWRKEYVDTRIIDGGIWKLSINYVNGNKKEYRGKGTYPNNFEAFERLNQKLIIEVQNG